MMRMSVLVALAIGGLTTAAFGRVPDIEDLIGIDSIGEARISPDGQWVAYTVTAADLEEDAYVSQIWLVDLAGDGFALTHGSKGSTRPRWSPDGNWITFLSSRENDIAQIFAIRRDGGEAIRLTDSKDAVSAYEWSVDGLRIAYVAPDPSTDTKSRDEHVGAFQVVRREYRHAHLWTFSAVDALEGPAQGEQLTRGEDFSVRDFAWSPDGDRIAFSATINPDLIQGGTADVYVVAVSDGANTKIVAQPGPDTSPQWSPDGSRIVFSTFMGRAPFFALNNELAVVSASGGEVEVLTGAFDEKPQVVGWNDDGIYFYALHETSGHLFKIDPAGSNGARVSQPDALMADSFSLSGDGNHVAFVSATASTLREVHVADIETFTPRVLTDSTAQVSELELGTRELLSWKSRDGAEIEGVLIKPVDFDPKEKHPLLCVVHGGPTGIDRPYFRDTRTYPVDMWAGRGALILKVNYRGSAGYGEAFRTLNVRNLGVGDAWDVLSGIDSLIDKGWVDTERIGCMGWSQGGYISAFLTTSTDRFAAISVGAGISNWATYYYNTDITPFTIHYLGDDPVDDPEIYEKTSPMSHIKGASTPTLIQHGENDRRVPIPNAYELRQGLEARNVPVEMVVYKGFGHGINKPRSQRAVMWHNLVWFNHYLWGDPLPALTDPELPKKAEEKAETP